LQVRSVPAGPATSLERVVPKLAIVARRTRAAEGFLTAPESALLRSALDDLRRLDWHQQDNPGEVVSVGSAIRAAKLVVW